MREIKFRAADAIEKDEDVSLVNSDTQSYKIAGNGIEVNTMRMIIRQLMNKGEHNDRLF